MPDHDQHIIPGIPEPDEPEYSVEPLPRTMPRFKVVVTEEIIKRAMPRDSHHCMIADAIKQQYPRFTHIDVDISAVYFTDPKRDRRYWFFLPRPAQEALIAFEYQIEPPPFEFWLSRGQVKRTVQAKTQGRTRPGDYAKRAIPTRGSSLDSTITNELPPKLHPELRGGPSLRPSTVRTLDQRSKRRGRTPKAQRVFGMRNLTSSTLHRGSVLARTIAREMGLPVEEPNWKSADQAQPQPSSHSEPDTDPSVS